MRRGLSLRLVNAMPITQFLAILSRAAPYFDRGQWYECVSCLSTSYQCFDLNEIFLPIVTMPFAQSGTVVSASVGAYKDEAENQYITIISSRLQGEHLSLIVISCSYVVGRRGLEICETTRPSQECLPGKRSDIANSERVPGKHSKMGHLGAFIFFQRDVAALSDPSTVIRTLAYKSELSLPAVGNLVVGGYAWIKSPVPSHSIASALICSLLGSSIQFSDVSTH